MSVGRQTPRYKERSGRIDRSGAAFAKCTSVVDSRVCASGAQSSAHDVEAWIVLVGAHAHQFGRTSTHSGIAAYACLASSLCDFLGRRTVA